MLTRQINSEQSYWQHAIILVDTNAFFAAIDNINQRYGEFIVAPAWKPYGPREII